MNLDTVVCIGSGPSLTREDVDYCRGRARVLVINDNYRLAPWATWMYACDYQFWKSVPVGYQRTNHELSRLLFRGERWTRDREAARQWGLHYIESSGLPGLSLDPSVIREGENGGYQSMNFVFHKGAKRILLLGYDMSDGHWFGNHPPDLYDAADFRSRVHHFTALASDLRSVGVQVVNCSRETMLTQFERSTIQEALP